MKSYDERVKDIVAKTDELYRRRNIRRKYILSASSVACCIVIIFVSVITLNHNNYELPVTEIESTAVQPGGYDATDSGSTASTVTDTTKRSAANSSTVTYTYGNSSNASNAVAPTAVVAVKSSSLVSSIKKTETTCSTAHKYTQTKNSTAKTNRTTSVKSSVSVDEISAVKPEHTYVYTVPEVIDTEVQFTSKAQTIAAPASCNYPFYYDLNALNEVDDCGYNTSLTFRVIIMDNSFFKFKSMNDMKYYFSKKEFSTYISNNNLFITATKKTFVRFNSEYKFYLTQK